MEFARIPCSRPSIASCRVIPMIPALAVVCASEPSVLKLKRAFRDAVFTTTPWLAFSSDHFSGSFSRGDVPVAADDRRTLASEYHRGRSADAAPGAGDDANLS